MPVPPKDPPAAPARRGGGKNQRHSDKRKRRHQARVAKWKQEEMDRRLDVLPCTWDGQVDPEPLDYAVVPADPPPSPPPTATTPAPSSCVLM